MKKLLCLLVFVSLQSFAKSTSTLQAKFVGNWELLTLDVLVDGKPTPVPGFAKAHGQLTYDPSGRMITVLSDASREKFPGSNPAKPDLPTVPADLIKKAFIAMTAYTGTYEVVDPKKVRHHIETAFIPNWEGTDQERIFEFADDKLTLTTEPLPLQGKTIVARLVWKRMK